MYRVPQSNYLTVKEASQITGRNPQLIRRWIQNGLPAKTAEYWPYPLLIDARALSEANKEHAKWGIRRPRKKR